MFARPRSRTPTRTVKSNTGVISVPSPSSPSYKVYVEKLKILENIRKKKLDVLKKLEDYEKSKTLGKENRKNNENPESAQLIVLNNENIRRSKKCLQMSSEKKKPLVKKRRKQSIAKIEQKESSKSMKPIDSDRYPRRQHDSTINVRPPLQENQIQQYICPPQGYININPQQYYQAPAAMIYPRQGQGFVPQMQQALPPAHQVHFGYGMAPDQIPSSIQQDTSISYILPSQSRLTMVSYDSRQEMDKVYQDTLRRIEKLERCERVSLSEKDRTAKTRNDLQTSSREIESKKEDSFKKTIQNNKASLPKLVPLNNTDIPQNESDRNAKDIIAEFKRNLEMIQDKEDHFDTSFASSVHQMSESADEQKDIDDSCSFIIARNESALSNNTKIQGSFEVTFKEPAKLQRNSISPNSSTSLKKPVLLEDHLITNKNLSLADAFRQKKSEMVQRLSYPRQDSSKTSREHERLSKLELYKKKKETKMRPRSTVVSRPKSPLSRAHNQVVDKSCPKLPPPHILDRLTKGGKAQISKKEMLDLTKKNFQRLPEIQSRLVEDRKKEEVRVRMAKAKLYNEVGIVSKARN